MADVVVELGVALREELREPFGPVSTDVDGILARAGRPLVTVGDVVTYHVLETGRTPDLAVVDERTKRTAVDEELRETVTASAFDHVATVENPPATLTAGLLVALRSGLDRAPDESTLVRVDGEEDLAALPVIAAAPDGTSVLYGQPDEGAVHVTVDDAVRARVRGLLERMDGDPGRALALVDPES